MNAKLLNNLHDKRVIIFTSKNNLKSQKLKQLGCEIIEMRLENNKLNLKRFSPVDRNITENIEDISDILEDDSGSDSGVVLSDPESVSEPVSPSPFSNDSIEQKS